MAQILLRVDDGTLEHVQLVVQCVKVGLRHHQLALVQGKFVGTLLRHPVPLATSLRAELPRPTRTVARRQHAPTPPAPPHLCLIDQFRHDENIAVPALDEKQVSGLHAEPGLEPGGEFVERIGGQRRKHHPRDTQLGEAFDTGAEVVERPTAPTCRELDFGGIAPE
jgi:hypothetical protein